MKAIGLNGRFVCAWVRQRGWIKMNRKYIWLAWKHKKAWMEGYILHIVYDLSSFFSFFVCRKQTARRMERGKKRKKNIKEFAYICFRQSGLHVCFRLISLVFRSNKLLFSIYNRYLIFDALLAFDCDYYVKYYLLTRQRVFFIRFIFVH